MAKSLLQKFIIFNMIIDSFLVEKLGTLEGARRYIFKNLLNLDCQDCIRFSIHLLITRNNSFKSHFNAKSFNLFLSL